VTSRPEERAYSVAHARLGHGVLRALAAVMESRLRYRFFAPQQALQGAGIRPGQTVLEIGCGTGFFTVPAARLLGERGSLVALDRLPASVEAVSAKVRAAGLKNVRVVEGNALDTKLEAESMDLVLIFGVIPAPMLPMGALLDEMGRVLRPGGTMAIWPPSWVHWEVCRSPHFTYAGKKHGVLKYRTSAPKLPARADQDLDLRPASERDREFLYALHRSTMRDVIEQTWGWDDAWQRADFDRRFRQFRVSVIEAGSRSVGSLWLEQRPDSLYIHELQVTPPQQGRGIGTAVIEMVIEQGASRGLPIDLSVVPANPRARDLYERLGFRVTCVEPPFMRMRHDL